MEEEFLIVDAAGNPAAVAREALRLASRSHDDGRSQDQDDPGPGGELEAELKQEQIETATHPCADMADLSDEVRRGRAQAQTAVARFGASIAAVGTCPTPVTSTMGGSRRYRRIGRQFALTAREQLTCGCHVHVAVEDDSEGVAVLDRIGPWLPPLLALSANSPFWQAEDSGFHSYRAQVWSRWPTAGPTATFGSAAEYHRVVDDLVATRTVLDAGMLYFDARLSAVYPTIEIRVADVCLSPDDAVLLAALCRGLVETAAREAAAGAPPSEARVMLLRAATWQASRTGMAGALLSPTTFRPVPAPAAVAELVAHVRDALADAGDLGRVEGLLAEHRGRGTGADRQRAWLAETGDLGEVALRTARATTA